MLDKLKRMFGIKGEVQDEVLPLYRGAKSKQEALILLKEALRRDESRRRRAMQDLEVFGQMEEELLEEGKGETAESRKLMIARRIKEIRSKSQGLNKRIEEIYNKRILIFTQHIESLQTAVEMETEPIPEPASMEKMEIEAKKMVEDLDRAVDLVKGFNDNKEGPQLDSEEQEILQEMERRADIDIEKEEPKVEKPKKETVKKEKPKVEKEVEKPRPEPKKKEEEPPQPEIIYED
jgi:hypothetical protein